MLDTVRVLDVLYQNDLEKYLAEESVLDTLDPTHLNDIDPLPDSLADEYPLFESGDVAVSLRHLDLIFVLNPQSERVKWAASEPWFYQHDPDWLGEGWIGVFDNRPDNTDRGTMLGGSRIVAVQPQTDSTEILFPTSRSEEFYTHHRGKWQALWNDNLLLTEEEAGRVVEVAPNGETVWEWVHAPIGEGLVPAVTKAVRVGVTSDDVSAWPCSPGASTSEEEQS